MSNTVFTSAKVVDDYGNQIVADVIAESKDFKPTESEFIDIIIDYDNETPNLNESQRLKFAEISFPFGFNKVFEVQKLEANGENEISICGKNLFFNSEIHPNLKDLPHAATTLSKLLYNTDTILPADTRGLYEEIKVQAVENGENKMKNSRNSTLHL